jgi:Alkylmercury lyase
MNLETMVKLQIYKMIAHSTQAPSAAEVAAAMNTSPAEIQSAFYALREQRLLVLEPDQPHHIRMAPPFSGVPTIHTVQVSGRSYYANCAWDAFGVAAALYKDAEIISNCSDCGELLNLQIRNYRPDNPGYVSHFAVPAAHWWDDIIET